MFYIRFGVTRDVQNVKCERFVLLPVSVSVHSANSCSLCLIKWHVYDCRSIQGWGKKKIEKEPFAKYTTVGAPEQTNTEAGRKL